MTKKPASTKHTRPSRLRRVSSVNRASAGVDPAGQAASLLQLRRARGQVEGVERMITDGRSYTEIIFQITAARASLQLAAKDLLTKHLRDCHEAAQSNGGAATDAMYREVVELVGKISK